MSQISSQSSLEEIAVLVSEALETAGISAILGGGGAVAQYSGNEYMSKDLDFITLARNKAIAPVVAKLGFEPEGKNFVHPDSRYFLEFPPGPLTFGDRYVEDSETATLQTKFGKLRIISPTHCVMDRLAWLFHSNDPQARDQAIWVARRQRIDWDDVLTWAKNEGIDAGRIADIRAEAEGSKN